MRTTKFFARAPPPHQLFMSDPPLAKILHPPLHKGDFRDALCLRFGWQPSSLSLVCICGKPFTVEHALSCSCGGYPSIRHNELRANTTTLLTEVSNNVDIEPVLQKLSDEHLTQKTSISSDDARLDIVAENFWGHNRQKTYFDVRVFNPFCATLSKVPLPQCYRRAELEKKRAYEQRIREIEFGSFSRLVFPTTGGLGSTATVVFKRLASLIADKQEQPYSKNTILASLQSELLPTEVSYHVPPWLALFLPQATTSLRHIN